MVIGIENKIDASETNDQLARYWLGFFYFQGQTSALGLSNAGWAQAHQRASTVSAGMC